MSYQEDWKPEYNKTLHMIDSKTHEKFYVTVQYCYDCELQRQMLSCGFKRYACTICGAVHKWDSYAESFKPTGDKIKDDMYNWSGRKWK